MSKLVLTHDAVEAAVVGGSLLRRRRRFNGTGTEMAS